MINKFKLQFILILILIINAHPLYSQEQLKFEKPHLLDPFTTMPKNYKASWNMAFNTKPKTLITWGTILVSSTIFYLYDEEIYKEVQRWGRDVGVGNDDKYHKLITFNGSTIMQTPKDTNGFIYFLGDGWFHTMIGAAFLTTGAIRNDNRALQAGSHVITSLLAGSIPTQIIKRSTGRQDPNRASRPRGRWDFFTKRYDDDVSNYDAVPSGHLMAAMSTATVIDSDYPEERYWTRPLSASLLSLLSIGMINTGVHWISDFPLALGIGYVFGRVVSEHGLIKDEESSKTTSAKPNLKVLPVFDSSNNDRLYGLTALLNF